MNNCYNVKKRSAIYPVSSLPHGTGGTIHLLQKRSVAQEDGKEGKERRAVSRRGNEGHSTSY